MKAVKKSTLWSLLFVLGLIMILGADEFSRWLANTLNWYSAGIILSVISGAGLLFDLYFRPDK